MCTIALLVEVVANAPLVLVANRDELYERATRPPERLAPGVVGGRDVLSGGTWLAVNRAGRFAAVTNQRALAMAPPGLRSRGLAVLELAATSDPDAYVSDLDPTHYASMNLVWGDARGVSIAYARQEGALDIVRLSSGIHVLCNDKLGAPGFPRGERLAGAIESAVAAGEGWPAIVPALHAALSDHTRVRLADVPPSHLPPELARELTATCIHSEHYGTRSATLLALGDAIDYRYTEGRPCTSPLIDGRALLEAA
jgi:uncharacterized protein with NRDE domain